MPIIYLTKNNELRHYDGDDLQNKQKEIEKEEGIILFCGDNFNYHDIMHLLEEIQHTEDRFHE